jgi:hypothetical protein
LLRKCVYDLPLDHLSGCAICRKCGTTSISKQLFDEFGFSPGHSFPDEIAWSDNKEHHFFDTSRAGKGLKYYASSFPACGEHVFTLDATPNGMYSGSARSNMVRIFGNERIKKTTFVFMLCDPLQRSQSFYYHFKSNGASSGYRNAAHHNAPNIPGATGSLYANGVDPWMATVADPQHPLLIIPSTAYYTNPAETLRALVKVVERNSGRTIKLSARCCSDKPPQSNSRSHPHLANDFDPQDARKVWSKFEQSNYHIYDLVAPGRHNSVILHPPSIRNDPKYQHFLETTDFMKRFILDPPPRPSLPPQMPPTLPPSLPTPLSPAPRPWSSPASPPSPTPRDSPSSTSEKSANLGGRQPLTKTERVDVALMVGILSAILGACVVLCCLLAWYALVGRKRSHGARLQPVAPERQEVHRCASGCNSSVHWQEDEQEAPEALRQNGKTNGACVSRVKGVMKAGSSAIRKARPNPYGKLQDVELADADLPSGHETQLHTPQMDEDDLRL